MGEPFRIPHASKIICLLVSAKLLLREKTLRGHYILCANLFRAETLTRASRTRRSPRSRTRGAALRPAASYAFLFWRGNALKNGMERQGSGGNGSTSSLKGLTWEEMSRSGCKYEWSLAKPISKEWRGSKSMCLPHPPSARTNPRRFEEKL